MPEEPTNPNERGQMKNSRGAGTDERVPCDEFSNIEDKGGWLTVRVKRSGDSVPVRITREAMEEHFGAGHGEKSLAEAYLEHSVAVNAKVLELAPSGDVYTTENPMRLGIGDF